MEAVSNPVEFLGHLAAEQDLIAADESLPMLERGDAMSRARKYREEQANILAPAHANHQVALSIIAEMEDCLHIGMDEAETWDCEFSDTAIPDAPTADPYRPAVDLWKGWKP